MTNAKACTKATELARERGPEPFSDEKLEMLARSWNAIIIAHATAGAAECSFKTPFSANDCKAQSGVMDYLSAKGFRAIPSLFISGEHRKLQFTVTWPPERVATRDKALGEKPWLPIPPVAPVAASPLHIPDDAVEEGGFYWWIIGEAPDLHVMCAGGEGGPCEVHNSQYPDEIWERMQKLDPSLCKT